MDKNNRLDYMDNLRALLMLLGIVIHSILFLVPKTLYPWPITESTTSQAYSYLALNIHVFRMPLFFLIAGFFAAMIFHKAGVLGFIKHRFKRIVLPFLICLFLLILYETGLVLIFFQAKPNVTFKGMFTIYNFTGQLWFLYYLIMLYIVMLIVLGCSKLLKLKTVLPKAKSIFKKPYAVLILSIPTIIVLSFNKSLYVFSPLTLIPNAATLLYYFWFFSFGWYLFKNQDIIATYSTWGQAYCLIAILILYPIYFHLQPHAKEWQWHYLTLLLYPTAAWFFSLGILGLCKSFLDKANSVLRYLADASYWIYLIQIPIILSLQIYFFSVNLPMFLKLICIMVISTIIMLISYALLVRKTVIGALLNGYRHKGSNKERIKKQEALKSSFYKA